KQSQAVGSELQSLEMAAVDEAKYLQLSESLGGFRTKLRLRADTLDVAVRQQILRLVVKEVLVGTDTITLRHSIPIPQSGPPSNGSPAPPPGVTGSRPNPGYLLRSGSRHSTTPPLLELPNDYCENLSDLGNIWATCLSLVRRMRIIFERSSNMRPNGLC